PETPAQFQPSTFYELFAAASQQWPENIAAQVQHPDSLESYSFRQLRTMTDAIAQWLQGNGFAPGTRAAILAENHPRWVATFIGTNAAACIVVPLDTNFTAEQVRKL